MIRRPPRSTPFPTRRSSDLSCSATRRAPSAAPPPAARGGSRDRKSTRLNSSHSQISYAVFCLKKKQALKLERHVDNTEKFRDSKVARQRDETRPEPRARLNVSLRDGVTLDVTCFFFF